MIFILEYKAGGVDGPFRFKVRIFSGCMGGFFTDGGAI